ncbi:hypothetical protein BGW37DRAFT_558799 [Umbelopsis sp. PMI_123]|nr:hypothetical protein BGW37DRAFT_558799 [Umbelopsis sp. PMI_123]
MEFPSYGAYPSNGAYPSYSAYGFLNNPNEYFQLLRDFKLAWSAFFALWLLWGLFWFLRHAFGDGTQPAAEATDTEAAQKGRWHFGGSHHHRINRSSEMLRDLVLLLLASLALNTFAGGISRAVMILSWIYFGFAIFWAVFEAAIEHHIARFIFAFVFYGIAIAIAALGYHYGF